MNETMGIMNGTYVSIDQFRLISGEDLQRYLKKISHNFYRQEKQNAPTIFMNEKDNGNFRERVLE